MIHLSATCETYSKSQYRILDLAQLPNFRQYILKHGRKFHYNNLNIHKNHKKCSYTTSNRNDFILIKKK